MKCLSVYENGINSRENKMDRTSVFPLKNLDIPLRVLAAVIGGWAASWSFVAFATAGLAALGSEFHDAETASLMLGVLLFGGIVMWAFAARSTLRVWAVLLGGSLLFNLIALQLQRMILS